MQPREFFEGTGERVQNSHGKRAISVQATEVLLYIYLCVYRGLRQFEKTALKCLSIGAPNTTTFPFVPNEK